MKTGNILFAGIVLGLVSYSSTFAFDLPYNNPNIKYTPTGVEIYGMPAKDFMAKGFSGQVSYVKGLKGSDANTLYTGGNSGKVPMNIRNIFSKGYGYVVANSGDTLLSSDGNPPGKGFLEIHGGVGNDVMLANGRTGRFFGEGGIDTIVFPGSLKDYVIYGDLWSVSVKNIKIGGVFTIAHHSTEQFQFDDAFFGYEAGENTIKVGPTEAFKKVMDALHVAGDGDIIEAASGVYEDDMGYITRAVTIRGVGGRAHFYAKSPSFMGKANWVTMSKDVTFENIEFSGNKVNDRNGAGIRMEGGIAGAAITLKNCYFHNNEGAVLAGNQPNGVLNIEDSEFGFNGVKAGTVHTINVGLIKALNVKNSYFHDSNNGHNIRSLAKSLNVANSFFYDGTANTSFNIEVAQAQNSSITGNTFVQTQFGENTFMILNTATSSSDISGNTFVNNSSQGVSAIYNKSTLPFSLNNNSLYNYKSFANSGALFTGTGNNIVDTINVTIPTANVSVGNVKYNNPTSTTPPVIKDASEFSEVATVAKFTGKDITVGVGKMYSSVKDASLAANSGDKIYVDEGVYVSDYSVIANKNLAIIGLGKGAEFKKVAAIPNQKAIFVTYKSNIYFKNIIFSDANVPDKNGAGIRFEGGTLTIVDSTFQNNENGILTIATNPGYGKIWINNSKFLNNGKNGVGQTHAMYIGEIDFFEIKNSTVRGTSVGHHVKSRARSTVIENNLLDDAGGNASYNIDLPNGGEALVKGNTLIQSAASPNRIIVSYSAEKNPTNPGKLIVENNVFESTGSTAIGVMNFKTNQVILRNNTFKNVSVKYKGSNVTEESSGATSAPSITK